MPEGHVDQLLDTLKTKTSAEVYSDNFNRGRYATDASIYQTVSYTHLTLPTIVRV